MTAVFINELHYDNSGTDTGEAIEIAGPAGQSLTGWSLVLYNGANGTPYDTRALAGSFADAGSGFGTLSFAYPSNGIQNGAPDGVALVDADGNVVQFLSYEGTLTADGGPADGMTSTDIGVAETGSTEIGQSLQLTGTGDEAEDFVWTAPSADSFGDINADQIFAGGGTPAPSVRINEFHYDNDGADAGEQIEVRLSAGSDLTGWSIVAYNGSNGASYDTYDLSGVDSTDSGDGFAYVVLDATGLQNGAPDGFALVDASGAVVEFLSYEGSLTASNGPAAGMSSVDVGAEEPSNAPLGSSIQRSDDGASWTYTEGENSFGAANGEDDEEPGGGDPLDLLISAVQGEGAETAFDGQMVSVEAIVVGDFQDGDADDGRNLGGFYLQEEDADSDGNALTSEGIFVYDPGLLADVEIGQRVRVTGEVTEYFGETQIQVGTGFEGSGIEILEGGELSQVTAAEIALPTAGTTTDQDGGAQPDLEAYEGMLVSFEETLTITEQFQLDRFNEIELFDTNGFEQAGPGGTTITGERPFQYSQFNDPDAAGNAAYLEQTGARTITYDDGLNFQNQPIDNLDGFQGYDAESAPRMGDTVTGLTGVLDYKWAGNSASGATWRVRSTEDGSNSFDEANPAPADTVMVDGALKVASFNVLNFFTTLDQFPDTPGDDVGPGQDQEPRGADSSPQDAVEGVGPTDEYQRQLDKLVEAISGIDADVLGLIEIENDFLDPGVSPGDQDAQEPRPVAIQALVDALNERLGAGTYDWVRPGEEFVGGDAIAVGAIYKPESVRVAEGTNPAILTDDVVWQDLLDRALVDNDADAAGGNIFNGPDTSRSPLAVTFEEVGGDQQELTVVVNHFKSKGGNGDGADADQGDGAGAFNNQRQLAAEALDAWLKGNPTGSDTDNTMLLGDFNAYAEESPIDYLTEEAGFVDVAAELLNTAYSYVFDGLVGTLDYAFASMELFGQIVDALEWHINADEADALDYNLEFGRDPEIFSADDPYRASDHDPVIVGIDLEGDGAEPDAGFETTGVNDWFNPSWGGGFNASFSYTVQDADLIDGAVSAWEIAPNYSGEGAITSAWVSGFGAAVGTGTDADGDFVLTTEDQSYQRKLVAGDVINFSIQVNGDGFDAQDFAFDFADIDRAPGSMDAEIDAGATNDWGRGLNQTIVLRNTGEESISAWQIELDVEEGVDLNVTSVWGATVEEDAKGDLIFTAAEWNAAIRPGGSANFGFNATYAGADSLAFEDEDFRFVGGSDWML